MGVAAFNMLSIIALGDPRTPENVVKPNADGSINTQAAVTASASDFSFTTGAATALIIPANASRMGYLIVNPSLAALNTGHDSIFVNFGAPATNTGDSIEIAPGVFFPPVGFPLFRGAIHILGAATGIKVAVKEFTA